MTAAGKRRSCSVAAPNKVGVLDDFYLLFEAVQAMDDQLPPAVLHQKNTTPIEKNGFPQADKCRGWYGDPLAPAGVSGDLVSPGPDGIYRLEMA